MSVQFDSVENEIESLPSRAIHIKREEVISTSGSTEATEYASHGTGLGVIVIPMTIGGNRLLAKTFRAPVDGSLWEFPRTIVHRISVAEAERCLFESTGLQATCRLIGTLAPDSSSLTTKYGVYEAFIESEGELPAVTSLLESRWFGEQEFALAVRDSELVDSLTLSSVALQSIEAATADF